MSGEDRREPDAAMLSALTSAVVARYGDRLTPEQVTQVEDDLRQLLAAARTLRAYKLTNADEPDFVFRAYRGEA